VERRAPADLVTIVIPTLNEAGAIGRVLDEVRGHGFTRIIVVDGGSTDGTREIAASRGARVVVQEGRGKADAIRTAVRLVDTPYTLIMDGDWTYSAAYIGRLLEEALKRGYDEVIGARLRGRENIPLLNRFGNWVITKAFNLLFGTSLSDVCSGMYLVRTDVLRRLDFECRGFSVEVEVAATVASSSRRIGEIPISYRRRIGRPKLGKRHGITILLDAIRLAVRYNPTFLIAGLGATITIPALAILAWVALELVFRGVKHHIWAILGMTALAMGLLSLLIAVLSLFVKRVEYRLLSLIAELQDELRRLQARRQILNRQGRRVP